MEEIKEMPEVQVEESENKCGCKCKCSCKCLPYAIMGVIALAVIALYFIVLSPKCCSSSTDEVAVATDEQLPIAYVNMDSLLAKYNLSNEIQDQLISEQERARATINQKANKLQADARDFQTKLENRAFLSEERARSEQERILRQQQELEQLDAKLTQELMAKQARMTDSLFTIIQGTIKEYNAEKGYHFIFGNTGNTVILYGNPGYDITNDILTLLNK
ncbi:MAG: OmpH family outer membrane protein [Paludibacteraceae bacterium]|nr:OmpH family outer membrane protein [Paludibacteraceae bacterium]